MKAGSSWPGIPPSVKAIAETLAHSSTHAYVARWRAAPPLLNRALVLNSKIAFFRQDTINLMSSRNNWVSGRGAAKLVVT